MTEIVRGDGMKYVLSYNAYHNLESIGIDGKTDGALVRYDYKAGNGRLKAVTYANGDTMKATYNSIGQMIAEKWYDSTETLTAHYKYTYDAQGNIVRSIDITSGKEYDYMYENGLLTRSAEYDITVNNELVTAKTHIASTRYYYDNEDGVCGILYNNTPYFFLKNLQGDIVAIVDKDSETVARYTYDAWGVCTTLNPDGTANDKFLGDLNSDGTAVTSDEFIGNLNPYRYRSYYYDSEIGLYYLQSRYYNPAIGMFVNGDSIEWIGTIGDVLGNNIFAYCKNDCVNQSDEVGYGGIDALLNVLSSCIDVITGIIDMIGNSYNKDKKKLESSIKLLTKKQKLKLSDIKSLQKETDKLSKRLGWIGHAITFLTIAIGFAASYKTGGNIDHSIIELAIETFIAVVEWGAGKFFELIAKFIPYVGFLLGLIAGRLVSYLLGKYFSNQRVKRIKTRFYSSVKYVRVSLANRVKNAVKSLTA